LTRLKSLRPDRPLSKREKFLAGVFLFFLAMSLYYFLVLEKQIQRIKYLQEQIAQRDAIVRDMYQKNYQNISDMENKIMEYDAMIARVYEMVPNIKDTPGLLVDFHRLLVENRLTSENITFGQLRPQQNYSTFTMGLKVKGLAHDVQNFLKSIEKYKRAVTINKLDFNPTEEGLLETSIDLTVYVMHDIAPDPLDYPFMSDRFGVKDLFDIFKYPEPKGTGETGSAGAVNPADIWNLFWGQPGAKGQEVPLTPGLPGTTGTGQASGAAPGQRPAGNTSSEQAPATGTVRNQPSSQ